MVAMEEHRRDKQVKKLLYKKQETKRQTEAKETNKIHHIIRKNNLLLSGLRKKGRHINSRRPSRQEDKDKNNEECDIERKKNAGE